MKKLYTTFILFIFFSVNYVYCQTEDSVSIDSNEYYSFYGFIPEKPVFFTTSYALTPNEIHVLDTLTFEERKFIEEAIDPPAIGVIRNLKEPILFSLSSIDIPAQGEISISGGRLSRINEDTLVFTTFIKSEKADEIRVFFSEGNFPDDIKVNLFGKNGYALNQSELKGKLDEYGFYSTTIFGDYVFIQIVIPVNTMNENFYFDITKVIHIDNRYMPIDLSKTDCYQDANCTYANGFANISYLRRATAQLLYPSGSGYYICSGGLLNDTRSKDFQPFLLTANHCFSTQFSASGLVAKFDYWSTSCNSGVDNPTYILVSGANLIKTNSQSDFTMVLLKTKPSGSRAYLGWSPNNVADNEILHSVHHPNGTLQKYSRHQNKISPTYNCTNLSTSNFHYTSTLGGQTHGGSSGGSIVNASGQIVGQLLGTCQGTPFDECSYGTFNNVWGKFSVSYSNNNLQYWLYSGGSSVEMTTSPASTLSFGTINVGSSSNLTVTITNTGTVPDYLNLEAGTAIITGTNSNQFSIIGSTFLYLPPNTSGTFTIKFSPTSAGTKTATLSIPHNADNVSTPKTITLTGYAAQTQPSYTISTSVFPSGSGYCSGSGNYTSGTNLTVTATPYTNKVFLYWMENGTIVSNFSSYYFIVNSNRNLIANFSTVGINENSNWSYSFIIYPNPTNNNVFINCLSNFKDISLTIFNLYGIQLKSYLINEKLSNINISDLSPGLYYLKLSDSQGNYAVKKILKN